MRKNEAWVRIGSALCVAMLGYLVISLLIKEMPLLWKICITSFIAILSFAVAFWAGKKEIQPTDQPSDIEIGTKISSKGSVDLKDVTVNTNSGEDVAVGSGISAEKNVLIQNIKVDSKG